MKQAKPPVPEPPTLTFVQNVIYSDNEGRSQFLEAGRPSPWRDLVDVPARFQNLVGAPTTDPPRDSPTQRWVPRSILEAEREIIEKLNNGDDLDPMIRDALADRDRESQKIAAARNQTYAEMAKLEDVDHHRLVAELEEEKRKAI